MRNLQIVSKSVIKPPYKLPLLFCQADHSSTIAIDKSESDHDVHKKIIRICPGQQEVIQNVHQFSEQELELLHPLDKAVQTAYAVSADTFFLASSTGGFYQLVLGSGAVEELFTAPSGISAFAVSPDSRLLVIGTKEETIILFALPDLEVLETIELGPQRPGDADEKLYEVSICWRGDSQYFAVNYFDGTMRRIQVYDDSGKLYSTTEDCNPVFSKSIAWQPSGGLIAAVGTSPSTGPNVTFFELNGLKRADFNPYESKTDSDDNLPVLDILWNINSDVLALRKELYVELWVRSNYVWMCKKIIFAESANEQEKSRLTISHVAWDNEIPYRMHMVASDGSYSVHEFAFTFSTGSSNGSALVASINGSFVYATPFRDTCAPPPNCLFQGTTESKIQEVVIANFWDGLLCAQTTGALTFFKNCKTSLNRVAVATNKSNPEINLQACYNWVWPSNSQVTCILNGNLLVFELSNTDFLNEDGENDMCEAPMTLFFELKTTLKVRAKCVTPIFVDSSKSTNFLIVQKKCGAILLQELCVMPNKLLGRLPNTLHHFKYMFTSGEVTENSLIVLGLDPLTRQLYALYKEFPVKILNDCKSIETFKNYLLTTTVQGSLEVIELKDILNTVKENGTHIDNLSKYSRKVEKGSVIVNCCWNRILEPSLTLQIIPRGNLETVSPRPLMISSIDILLKDKKYNEVMIAMRRHRLDFNVLANQLKVLAREEAHDENDAKAILIEKLNAILEDVRDSHTLVLMVTEMGAEHDDCVKYIKDILHKKMNVISNHEDVDIVKRIVNPYLAVMAKLNLYKEALKSPLITVNNLSREVVKARVKFLGFYCDNPEILYESALGTYDLNLTSLVADCLNKDPKEYLPILNEYRSYSDSKLKFSIDNKLKRYSKAVISLLEQPGTSDEEILKYTERHRVHQIVIQYLENSLAVENKNETEEDLAKRQRLRKQVYCSYGKLFEDERKLVEAAICYSHPRGDNFEKCFECYGKSGNWTAAIHAAKLAGLSDDSNDLWLKLVKHLDALKDYESAGHIMEYHLKDEVEAFKFYIRARKWEKASRLVDVGHDYLFKVKYHEELDSCAENLLESCVTLKDEIKRYGSRLRVVKALKEKMASEGNLADHDNFSDTESVSTTSSVRSSGVSSSMQSGKTYRSGKNLRKLKRKVFSLKEGSRFEDIGIQVHLWDTIQRIQQEMKPEIESVIPALWTERKDQRAQLLIASFDALLHEADDCVKEVWATVQPQQEFLELKYCVPPVEWSPSWNKYSVITATTSDL